MGFLIRMVVPMVLAVVFFAFYRQFTRGTRSPSRRAPELEMPYCLKCESNRQVVANPGRDFPREQYPWYCQHCREFF